MKYFPNKLFYYIAKEYLRRSYSEKVANGFFDFKVLRKHFKRSGNITVQCFNGGAFISLRISEKGIMHSGNYKKRRFFDTKKLVADAISAVNIIPAYYYVSFSPKIDCYQRCVSDIEKAKIDVINYWNKTHTTIPIDPTTMEWFIKEV